MESYTMFMDWNNQYYNYVNLSPNWLIDRTNLIETLFFWGDWTLKCIWKEKGQKMRFLKNKSLKHFPRDIKVYYKTIEIKTVSCWLKEGQFDQWFLAYERVTF